MFYSQIFQYRFDIKGGGYAKGIYAAMLELGWGVMPNPILTPRLRWGIKLF